jgi:hypothetical protein
MDPKGGSSSTGGIGQGGQEEEQVGQQARPQEVVQQVFQVDAYTAAFMLVLLVLALFKVRLAMHLLVPYLSVCKGTPILHLESALQ